MSSSYKRLLNEYKNINFLEQIVSYKLYTINTCNIMFRCDIDLIYKKKKYIIKIFYNNYYPFECPIKIELNNYNIFNLYKKIMQKNNELFDTCICCNSILCSNNWNISMNVINILEEIKKIIEYNELYTKRILLNKIIIKYTNQNMDYLQKYLI